MGTHSVEKNIIHMKKHLNMFLNKFDGQWQFKGHNYQPQGDFTLCLQLLSLFKKTTVTIAWSGHFNQYKQSLYKKVKFFGVLVQQKKIPSHSTG